MIILLIHHNFLPRGPDACAIRTQRPLFININAGVLLENGKAWNIRNVSRHADAWMILEKNVLRFYGFLMIDKVDVSIRWEFVHYPCKDVDDDGEDDGNACNNMRAATAHLASEKQLCTRAKVCSDDEEI